MTSQKHEMTGALGIRVERDVPVVMRDGVVLRANVFRPDSPGRFCGLLLRTPYGKPNSGYDRIVRSGYAVVTQDSRGRYASEGDYTPFTVEDTGDAEDGYDTIEWLAAQPWCNGRVGTFGKSYNAWMQWKQAALRPPHLVAMCAWTIPLELTEVDWTGAFRPGRRIRWWFTTMAPDLRKRAGLPPPHDTQEATRIWNEIEHGRWLGHMPWADIPKYLPPRLAGFAAEWLAHPASRPWRFDQIHSEVEVPNFDVSGYYDHCGGTMAHLRLMQRNARSQAAREGTRLIIGPWNHAGLGKQMQGSTDFGAAAEVDLDLMMIRWFDYWLKGLSNGTDTEPPVRYFVMGSGKWKASSSWPPPGLGERTLYLGGDGTRLAGTLAQKSGEASVDAYRYDPADPVPTLWSRDLFTAASDRRSLEYRTDILTYRTGPLEAEIETVGYGTVTLFASSTAPDTDFFARLVDEYPDGGPAMEVCYGMVRARHRHTVEREELLTPREVTEFVIHLGPTACRFGRGHRIRLEITSSDFPNHDRNHNTGGNDLEESELRVAEQQVFHGGKYRSRIVLPVDAGEEAG